MNNHEAASSDEEDDAAMDELTTELLKAEGIEPGDMQVDPAVKREQDILAELARRRKEQDAGAATKRKSDEIFAHFDKDGDGHLNYAELRMLGQATGGELPENAYKQICQEIGANPAKGVSKELLLLMYTDAGLGDAHRDYNLIFNK